ncbi:MAG: response regulator [Sutterellaceae bacterium]|nr:response regulator [Sutterellaceae bacterium]
MKPLIRIVDDDEALAASTAMLLESMGWETVSYTDGAKFLAEDDFTRPGCIILDVRMPGMTGLDVQAQLEKIQVSVPILFLSAHGTIQMAVHTVHHGAVDFLEKPVDPMVLVQKVAQCVSNSVSANAEAILLDAKKARFDELTPRENDVVKLVLANAANKVIARELGLEVSTVKMHRANAFAKLGVHSPSELIKLAYEVGIVDHLTEEK